MNGQGFGQNAGQGRGQGGLGRGRGLGRGNCQRLSAPDAQGEGGVLMIAQPGDEGEVAQGVPGGRFGARRGMAARAGLSGFGGQGVCRRQRRRDGSCGQ